MNSNIVHRQYDDVLFIVDANAFLNKITDLSMTYELSMEYKSFHPELIDQLFEEHIE